MILFNINKKGKWETVEDNWEFEIVGLYCTYM